MLTLDDDRLTDTFAALASTTRRSILARLVEGEATVNDLAEPFDLTLPAVSKHIKVLEDAGLIVRSRRAQFRPCALNPEALHALSDWVERFRPIWGARFDALDNYLEQLQPKPERQPR